jgi:hypothetical protein
MKGRCNQKVKVRDKNGGHIKGPSFLLLAKKMRKLPLMKRVLSLCILILWLALIVSAQKGKVPTFSQYPAKLERARAKAIDFKHDPDARTFKTRLSEGLREGVNFAGHYVVVGWGCGTGCISGAIVDARNGRVYFPEAFHDIGVWYDDSGYTGEPVKHRKNSRLFVISGVSGDQGERVGDDIWGDYYYEWKDNGLKLIRFVRKKRTNEQ